MDSRLIAELIQLRYKLTWAKTRSRNGRIALFLVGYLLLVLLITFFAGGGFAGALLAMRSGRAETLAQALLSGVFIQALISTTVLGFGLNAIFSESELRRYPVKALERRAARHLVAIADPFWFLFLVFELGLAFGLYAAGVGSFWLGLFAALVLFLCNYLSSRVLAMVVDRLMQHKSGTLVLVAGIMSLAILPSVVTPMLRKNPAAVSATLEVLRYSPPFGAAAAMVSTGAPALYGFGIVVCWSLGLLAALVALERRPSRPKIEITGDTVLRWEGPLDRLAAFFGPEDAPLIAHWLRFYARNTRFRTLSILSLPLMAFLTYNTARGFGANGLFAAALGTVAFVSFLGTSRISVNLFGYVGGAFRRYFLLPTDPAAPLRTGSYASLLLGSLMLPVALLAWLILAPVAFDARMLVMLAGAGITGLFVFHGLGLWVTLYNPRRGNYNSSMGNDLSLGGNVLLIGGIILCLFTPRLLLSRLPAAVSPANWWEVIPLVLAGIAFYHFSLKAAGAMFPARREKLLAIVEGKS